MGQEQGCSGKSLHWVVCILFRRGSRFQVFAKWVVFIAHCRFLFWIQDWTNKNTNTDPECFFSGRWVRQKWLIFDAWPRHFDWKPSDVDDFTSLVWQPWWGGQQRQRWRQTPYGELDGISKNWDTWVAVTGEAFPVLKKKRRRSGVEKFIIYNSVHATTNLKCLSAYLDARPRPWFSSDEILQPICPKDGPRPGKLQPRLI